MQLARLCFATQPRVWLLVCLVGGSTGCGGHPIANTDSGAAGDGGGALDGGDAVDASQPGSPALHVSATAESPLAPGEVVDATLTVDELEVQSIAWSTSGPFTLHGDASTPSVAAQVDVALVQSQRVTLTVIVVGIDDAGVSHTLTGALTWLARVTPQPADDSYLVGYETPLDVEPATGVLSNDGLRAGDHTNLRVTQAPQHGRVVLGYRGDFTYVPDVGYHGADRFAYAIDEAGVLASAEVTLRVGGELTAVDDLIRVSGTGARSWFTPAMLTANDVDPEGGALQITYDPPVGVTLETSLPTRSLPMPRVVLDFSVPPAARSHAYFQGAAVRVSANPGTYPLPYTIVNAAGDSASAVAVVHVLPEPRFTTSTLTGAESTVISLPLAPKTAHVSYSNVVVANGTHTWSFYRRYWGGVRGPLLPPDTEVLARDGRVVFVPQAFKHSTMNPDGSWAPYLTGTFHYRTAFEQTTGSFGVIVEAVDNPP